MSVSFKNVLKKHAAKVTAFIVSLIVLSLVAFSAAFASPDLIKVNERITELKEEIKETEKSEETPETTKEVKISQAYSYENKVAETESQTQISEPEVQIGEERTTLEELSLDEAEPQTEEITTSKTEIEPQKETETQTEKETKPEPTTVKQLPQVQVTSPATTVQEEIMSNAEKEVLIILNKERAENGIKPLVLSNALQKTAQIRTRELIINFSHTRPNGESCFTAFPDSCNRKGENIAMGYKSPEQVMNGWMKSEGHRANILNPNFTHVGIGAMCIDDKWVWIQCFGEIN